MFRAMEKAPIKTSFLRDLKSGAAEPFKELRIQRNPKEIEEKLALLAEQEEFADATARFMEASGLKEYRKKLENELKESRLSEREYFFKKLWDGLRFFTKIPVIKATFSFIKAAGLDYYLRQYQKNRETPIASPLDDKIPLKESCLKDYLSFVSFWIAATLFIQKEFGDDAAEDGVKIITDMAGFYTEAGRIFKEAQTTFDRGDHPDIASISFLRKIDRPKNVFPSLHAEVASHTYSRLVDAVEKYAEDSKTYRAVKEKIFKRAVRILESCLFTKQHSLRDIPAGLAAISSRDSNFTSERALALINGMFDDPEISAATEIKQEMSNIYVELMENIKAEQDKDYTEILIAYIKRLGDTDKTLGGSGL